MRTKVSQTKLSEQTQKELKELYGTTYSAMQEIIETYLKMRNYTLWEIKNIGFSKEELIALIDSLNGLMLDASMSCSASALSAQMADFEELKSGISRHEAHPETLLAKLKTLTAAQSHFLQFEIKRFWENNLSEGALSLEEFIKTLQK